MGPNKILAFTKIPQNFQFPVKVAVLVHDSVNQGIFLIYIYVTELFNEAFLILLNQEFLCNKYKEFHFRILDFNSNNN